LLHPYPFWFKSDDRNVVALANALNPIFTIAIATTMKRKKSNMETFQFQLCEIERTFPPTPSDHPCRYAVTLLLEDTDGHVEDHTLFKSLTHPRVSASKALPKDTPERLLEEIRRSEPGTQPSDIVKRVLKKIRMEARVQD
jgi:hypothetical protein